MNEQQLKSTAIQCSCSEYQCPCHKQLIEVLNPDVKSGEDSRIQQAKAWSAVYATLKDLGLDSYFNIGTGRERVVSFIKYLANGRKDV